MCTDTVFFTMLLTSSITFMIRISTKHTFKIVLLNLSLILAVVPIVYKYTAVARNYN